MKIIYPQLFIVGILFSLVLGFNSCKSSSSSSSTPTSKHKGEQEFDAYLERKRKKFIGQSVPNIIIETINGTSYTLSKLDDNIVLLNFWFNACKPCITEVPSLNELHDKYQSEKLLVLSVSTDDIETTKKSAVTNKMRYQVAADGKHFAKTLEVSSYPTSFLIDKKGIIREVFIGASSFDATHTYMVAKPHIEKLLAE